MKLVDKARATTPLLVRLLWRVDVPVVHQLVAWVAVNRSPPAHVGMAWCVTCVAVDDLHVGLEPVGISFLDIPHRDEMTSSTQDSMDLAERPLPVEPMERLGDDGRVIRVIRHRKRLGGAVPNVNRRDCVEETLTHPLNRLDRHDAQAFIGDLLREDARTSADLQNRSRPVPFDEACDEVWMV